MQSKINVGMIGMGARGQALLKGVLLSMRGVCVAAVCDLYSDRADDAANIIKKSHNSSAAAYTRFEDMLDREKLDAVIVSCSWEDHVSVACAALERGVAVAMEVGGCYDTEEAWRLVNTWERTKTPFMFLENCCFDRGETLATNLVRAGVLGKIVHCSGAYAHDLRQEIAGGYQNRHYRLRNYLHRNCENYPTHEVGPIAKILNINRGNLFVKLTSVASLAAGMEQYICDRKELYPELEGKRFAQGDIVDTIITCAGGETVLISLDTTLPRFYDRALCVRGTKGLYDGSADMVFVDGVDEDMFDTRAAYKKMAGNSAKYIDYLPAAWRDITPEQMASGHGGMDYLELKEFFDCLKTGAPMPIDVYDAAAWMSVTALSEQSIATGGAPVVFPDYTRGKWTTRPRLDVSVINKT